MTSYEVLWRKIKLLNSLFLDLNQPKTKERTRSIDEITNLDQHSLL